LEHTGQDRLWIALSSVEGMDAQAFYRLIAEFGDAGAVFSAAAEDARLDKFPAALRRGLKRTQSEEYIDGLFTNLELKGVDALSRLHPDYPAVMQDIYLPPLSSGRWRWWAAGGPRATVWTRRS